MKVLATLDGESVTIVEVNIEATKIFITYIKNSTQELFVDEKHRILPDTNPNTNDRGPTLIATGASAS